MGFTGNWLDDVAERGRRTTDGDVSIQGTDPTFSVQPLPKAPDTVPLTPTEPPPTAWRGRVGAPRQGVDSTSGESTATSWQPMLTAMQTPPAPIAPTANQATTTSSGWQNTGGVTVNGATYNRGNAYGSKANLDPAYLEQQIRAAFAKKGATPTADELNYWIEKVSRPDTYSDNRIIVGWNPYREAQLLGMPTNPAMAGTEGVVANGVMDLQGGGPASPGGGYGGGSITPGQYDDAATNDLLNFAGKRATDLQNMQPVGGFADYIAQLVNASGQAQNSPAYGRLQDMISKAIADTSGDPYTSAQGGALRSNALANLQATRDAQIENLRREMAAKNISPESGIYQQRIAEIDKAYQGAKAGMERDLTIDAMNRLDENRQFGLSAATNALTAENAQQSTVLGLLKEILGTNLSEEARQQGYLDKALSMFSLPVSIADQRFQDALAAAGMSSGNPSNLLQTLATLQSNTNLINSQNAANSQNLWLNLGQLLNKIDWSKFGKK